MDINDVPPSGRRADLPGPRDSFQVAATSEYDPFTRESGRDLRDVLGVLRRHLGIVVGVTALVLGITVYMILTQAPRYRARAMIRLQDERGSLIMGIEDVEGQPVLSRSNDPLLSELEVLRSRAVADNVVQRTPLRFVSQTDGFPVGLLENVAVDPEAPRDTLMLRFAANRYSVRDRVTSVDAAYGDPIHFAGGTFTISERPAVGEAVLVFLAQEAAIVRFLSRLEAEQREKTDVVNVAYIASDPRLAQHVANVTVEEYIRINATAAQESSRRRRVFLEEQLLQMDSMLAGARVALSSFRRRETVYSSQQKLAAQQTGLMGIEVRREELDADRRMYQSLLSQIESAPESDQPFETLIAAPGLANNPVISQLHSQLIQYRVARDSLTAGQWGSTETNPDVQRINGLIRTTEAKLIRAARSHVDALQARIAALDDLRGRQETELQMLPEAEAEEMRLTQRVETIRVMADQLRQEYQRAQIAERVEVGQVALVHRAPLPTVPIGEGRGLKLGLGLILGLMFGSFAAFTRDHLNTSIYRREEMETLLAVPTLAVIPQFKPGSRALRIRSMGARGLRHGSGNGTHPRNMPGADPVAESRAIGADAYRILRTNLLFNQKIHAPKVVMIASAVEQEGKTTIAANLAVAFAQQGMRVLLVDCDLRRPSLTKLFGLAQGPGLREVLSQEVASREAIYPSGVEGLDILPSGAIPTNPSELLGSEQMSLLLEEVAERYDSVFIDTPPLLAAAEAAILSTMVDGVVVVVRAGATARAVAQLAKRQLDTVGARVLGSVLNDPDAEVPRSSEYYHYSYQRVER